MPKNKNNNITTIILIVNTSSILYNYINFMLNNTNNNPKPSIPVPHTRNELFLHPHPPPFIILNILDESTAINITAHINNNTIDPKNIIGTKLFVIYILSIF